MQAPLLRSVTLTDALSDSRAALTSLQGQLDDILAAIRAPGGRPEDDSADRLRGATAAAARALASLRALSRR
jgi:hypothetical protein